jgi:hypothetical protein
LNQGRYDDYWLKFAQEPRRDFVPPCWDELEREELVELLKKCYKSFYLRPKYILKHANKARKNGTMGKKIKAGLRVLRGG